MRRPQHAFTEAIELAGYDQLDLEFKALSLNSPERLALRAPSKYVRKYIQQKHQLQRQ